MIHIGSQSCGPHGHGLQRLNINLLKPDRFSVSGVGQMVSLRNAQAHSGWPGVQYAPRCQCPLLRFLPHFLATFIVENLADSLNLPAPPAVQPRQSSYEDRNGRKWSIGLLNKVLEDVLVCEADGTDIAVLGCAESQSFLMG